MRTINTTAIIVALTMIISLDAAANTDVRAAGSASKALSFGPAGPGKKVAKPVAQPEATTTSVDGSATTGKQSDAMQTKGNGYQRNFTDSGNAPDTTNVGEAILNLMFGGTTKETTASNAQGRRVPPTLKKID